MPEPGLDLDRELGEALRDLAAHVDAGDVPDLGARVAAQIDAAHLRPPVVQRRIRRVVIAVAAVVLGGASVTAAPAVADWLRERVGGIEIRRDPAPAPPPSAATESALGRRTTLAGAQRAAPFRVRRLGPPYDRVVPEVWLDDAGGIAVVSLVYGDVLVQQFAAPLADRATMTKLVGRDTVVEEVEVDDQGAVRGLWIEGPHAIALRGGVAGDDQVQVVAPRRAGNTLVWEANGVTHRLESELGRSAALARASTLR